MASMIHAVGGLVFVWRGGAYIDIYAEQGFDVKDPHNSQPPYEVINVWNYAQDRANIVTLEEFEQECNFWVASREREVEDKADNWDWEPVFSSQG